MKIICDNTELTSIWGAESPDILVIGGYSIDEIGSERLIEEVETIKEDIIGDAYVPVKWNIRDLRTTLEHMGYSSYMGRLMEVSDELRARLLSCLIDSGATVFLSIINAYSNRRQVLGRTRQDLIAYSFGNLLMRVGLHIQSLRTSGAPVDRTEVVLDWPDGGNRKPFIDEYYSGWKYGRSADIQYFCGPLSELDFHPSPLFTITYLDPRLQLADLVVGASKSFVDFCMGRATERDFGTRTFASILSAFYAPGGVILGRGISISPSNSTLSDNIQQGLESLED